MPPQEEQSVRLSSRISHNTTLTLGVLVTIIGATTWLIRGQAGTEFELKLMRIELKQAVNDLNLRLDSEISNRWTSTDMRRWVRETRKLNPTLVIPDPEHE
jgi:hypothetical protein